MSINVVGVPDGTTLVAWSNGRVALINAHYAVRLFDPQIHGMRAMDFNDLPIVGVDPGADT